ncbi:heat stress transcription factor A-7a-like [Heracleum sosnowskyi]|uniref:Heat stress transcription factor A-7a-like n=1 Tax=Heracleum sosnowskyi TaxID=360622 RepID=A0AAD8IRX5_9APIA|nr:heat stress transcription factor A-7a-like [Heracleum sosnowskyi]
MEGATNEQTETDEWYNNKCITIAGDGHGCGRSDRRLITTNRRGLKVPPFLNKVYKLVTDPETNDIISWTSDGTSFTVWDHHMFTKNILPAYFRHDNFSSFVYQLNNYGFKKTSWDNWEYENKWFQQGKDYMLVNIRRKNQISSAAKRNRAVSLYSDNLVSEAPLESENSEINQVKLEVQKLVKKQEIMEKELGTVKDQIESLFRQQKIVISMFNALLPTFSQHLHQNVIEQGVIEEAEFEKETAENVKIGNGMELVVADHYTSQQNSLFDSGNLVENTEHCYFLENLMAIDEDEELQGELANQQSNIVMELEGLMTQAESGGYIEFMSQVEFEETKPAI